MTDDQELAVFQAALLSALSEEAEPERALVRLQTDPRCAPFAEWIEGFEPEMLEVAAHLVRKWGRRVPSD